MVLKDGSYRCCFELDGVHVSGFDEVRLVSLMNHFTGFLNGIDTSVQLTVVCHNISKSEYFQKHPVECTDDHFLRYVARVVENDQAALLSRNFIPELKFYATFCYRPPKEKPQKQSFIKTAVNNVLDAFTSQAARQSVGGHFKNVTTLVQRANGYVSQLGSCGMVADPYRRWNISACSTKSLILSKLLCRKKPCLCRCAHRHSLFRPRSGAFSPIWNRLRFGSN